MQAINYEKYGGADVMQVSELPTPTIADDEVLIRVHAASINPYDWKLRNGLLRNFFDVEFPVTPGRDGCGEVVAIGQHANWHSSAELRIGQRVCFISSRMQDGTLAEYAAVKAADFIAAAPQNMSDQQCASLLLITESAYSALVETAKLLPGMKVLIHGGSGGVGSMAVQLAVNIGADVYATCSSRNTEQVEALGATAIPYDGADFSEAISDCDVVFDTIGGAVHEKSYTVLKKGGQLVYLNARPFNDVSGNYDVETKQVNVMSQTGTLQGVVELAASGVLQPSVSDALPLCEFKEAFQIVESGSATGKVVLLVGK